MMVPLFAANLCFVIMHNTTPCLNAPELNETAFCRFRCNKWKACQSDVDDATLFKGQADLISSFALQQGDNELSSENFH